jgi:predicted transcriptional regulator
VAKKGMTSRHPIALARCPNCGARLMPTPKELKQWRQRAGLSQRQMAARLKISSAYIAYLEAGKRSPSQSVIWRYKKFIPHSGD